MKQPSAPEPPEPPVQRLYPDLPEDVRNYRLQKYLI